jgi:hypothetical protein
MLVYDIVDLFAAISVDSFYVLIHLILFFFFFGLLTVDFHIVLLHTMEGKGFESEVPTH